MRIETSTGNAIEGRILSGIVIHGKRRLIVEAGENVTMAQAADALDGAEWIRASDAPDGKISTTYKGFGKIKMISLTQDGGVRVTLEEA